MTKLRVLVLCFPYFTKNSTTAVPFQVRHKLDYFHFFPIFQKKNIDYAKFNQGDEIQIHDQFNEIMKPFISLTKSIARNLRKY
jgi:hypothetical protein